MSLFTKCNILKCANRLNVCQLETPDKSLFLRIVRWRTRRWTPTSQTKLYFVPERKPIDAEEAVELRQRQSVYNTSMRAIRTFIKEQAILAREHKADKSVTDQKAHDVAELLVESDQWNSHSGKLREARLSLLAKVHEEESLRRLIQLEEEERRRKDKANILIQQEMEARKTFITIENLDDEVEKALNNRVVHNFVMDASGKTYAELADGSLRASEGEEQLDSSLQGHSTAKEESAPAH